MYMYMCIYVCIERYAGQLDPSMRVIVAGDFNECSHLDWTEATKDLCGHNGVVMPWKNSQVDVVFIYMICIWYTYMC